MPSIRSVVCVVLGVLTLFLGAGPGRAGGKQVPRPELALVPRDSFAFVHFRPGDLWRGEIVARVRQFFPRQAETILRREQDVFGEEIDLVESITHVFPTESSFRSFFGMGPLSSFDRNRSELDEMRALEEIRMIQRMRLLERDAINLRNKIEADKDKKQQRDERNDELLQRQLELADLAAVRLERLNLNGDLALRSPDERLNVVSIVTTLQLGDPARVARKLLGESQTKKYKDRSYLVAAPPEKNKGKSGPVLATSGWALHFVNERTFLVARSTRAMEEALDRKIDTNLKGPLAGALELAAQNVPVVAGMNFGEPSARDLKKRLAYDWQLESIWSLLPLLNVRSATLTMEAGKDCTIKARLAFADAEGAAAAERSLRDALVLLRLYSLGNFTRHMAIEIDEAADPTEGVFWTLASKQVESAMRRAVISQVQGELQVTMRGEFDLTALYGQAQASARELLKDETKQLKRMRRPSAENLKQIMLGMHGYHNSHRNFPAAALKSAEGKPVLSWRVAILPHLGHEELFKEFKLDESWDSPHNIKLLPRMPAVYGLPKVKTKEPYTTFYQGFVGIGSLFQPNSPGGVRITEITDGTSNTIAIVEAGEPVPWTRPADLPFDQKLPLPKLGGIFPDGFNAAYADGSVHFIPRRTHEYTLRALITINGGEAVDLWVR